MTAIILVFPLARNRAQINVLVHEMASRSRAEAQNFLVDHIEAQWQRLEDAGAADKDIEREMIALSTAVKSKIARPVEWGIEA